MNPVFLSAEWRYLVMLNYEVDPAVVEPFVPQGTELDFWNGRTFVSLVGFRFLKTRVLGWGIPFHRNFDEVNLRLYVRRESPEGIRRGVTFVKEIVPRFAIAVVARWAYGENYVAHPMASILEPPAPPIAPTGEFTYGWNAHGRRHTLYARVQGAPAPLEAGSEAEFITEHYWGYVTDERRGVVNEYQVEHPPWRVWEAIEARFDGDAVANYGSRFAFLGTAAPSSVFVAEGSPIVVRRPSLVIPSTHPTRH